MTLTSITNERFWGMTQVERRAFESGANLQLKQDQAQLAKVPEKCPECKGKGGLRGIKWDEVITSKCPVCNGTGLAKPDRDELRKKILTKLAKQCQAHEHRGCTCTPEFAEECWGSLATELSALIDPDEKMIMASSGVLHPASHFDGSEQ